MAAWPRDILPIEASDFEEPGALISRAQSGKVKTRSTTQVGRRWTETYLVNMGDISAKKFLATIRKLYRKGEAFTLVHQDYTAPNGAGGGSPVVDGASQTGASLNIRSGPVSVTNWLRAGDIFTVVGVPYVLEATADVNTDGTGDATIPINPSIWAGGSPADGAVLTISSVSLTAIIAEPPEMPSSDAADFGVVRVTFMEQV